VTISTENQNESAVSLSHVSKRFTKSGPLVLDEVSLDVKPGEFVCLLGASGCGKSTLLSLIADLEKPSSGSIQVEGKPALMFQEPALLPWLTASKNIELALQLRGISSAERQQTAMELLEMVHLERAARQRPHELSGGMRQRVALARSIAQGGRVLLMDEPFAALDAETRDILHEELIRVWQATGMSIIFVTHNVREAVRLGQRVLLMSSRPGRIIQEWNVEAPEPRRIEDEKVSKLAAIITTELREEIRRHAA
jgi:NitT/TauT family transport system ATP-binding protein